MKRHVIVWVWGRKYGPEYVERLAAGIKRNLDDCTFTVCRPLPEDEYLTELPGCLCRLRTFDPCWQKSMGFKRGERILCLDLDLIVTGRMEPLFDREEPFVILQGANAKNPCRFNGSVWSVVAGYRPDIWTEFSVEAANAVDFYIYPEDQAYFEAKMPEAGAYGAKDGVYGFKKTFWPVGDKLPSGARIVAFPGSRDPSQFTHLPWVKEHWR